MNLRDIYDKNAKEHIELPYGVPFMLRDDFEQAIADYEKSKWKSGEEFPDLLTHQGRSRSVIAEVEGYKQPLIMCAALIQEDDGFIVWARVEEYPRDDYEWDDNYNVIRWTEIPTTPKP